MTVLATLPKARFVGVAVVSAAMGMAAMTGASAAQAKPGVPPRGTSFWLNQASDLVVVKRSGNKVRIGNALSPCFTGLRQSDNRYRGGGDTQGGFYQSETATFTFKASKRTMTIRFSKSSSGRLYPYGRESRKDALRQASPRPDSIRQLFSDCRLP